jgi:putative peptidoglycan lipid II flippase
VRESEGIQAAQRLLSSGTCLHILMLSGLSLALALSQRWLLPILASGFDHNKLALVRLLFFLLLSSLLLSGLTALWRAVLTAHESFAVPGIAPICIPIAIAAFLFVRAPTWRIYTLVFGSLVGVTAELAVNGYAVWRLGISLVPRWHGLDSHLRQVLAQSVPAAAAAMLMGSTIVVDQSMAAMLGSGAVSALNYANRLPAMLFGVGATSLSIAAFPALSRLSANNQWSSVRGVLSSYTRIILVLTLPVVIILIIYSEPLVKMLYQRGAFTGDTTHFVAGVQSILFLEVPFYGLCVLCASAVCALKRNNILLWGTVICVVVNVVLNYVFMTFLGLRGIALSTVAVYVISFIYLRVMLGRALGEEESTIADKTSMIAITPEFN